MSKRPTGDPPEGAASAADPADLAALRARVAEVDLGLLELLGRRLELASAIGRAKAEHGEPLVARGVEEQVLRRALEAGAPRGLPEALLGDVFRAILRASLERQRHEARGRLPRRGRVLVIGGAGGMGRWFGRLLDRAGWDVARADPALAGAAPDGASFEGLAAVPSLEPFGALVLAVPLGLTAQVIDELVARRPRVPLVEIASIQTPLEAALARAEAAGIEVLCAHPMFGPSKSLDEPATFVLALRPGRPAAQQETRLAELLGHPWARIVPVPFAAHDELMAWLLGLSHLAGMLFASSLARSGQGPGVLADAASTTFRRQVEGARSILAEDPDLYLDIQHQNPHRARVYRAVREALGELERVSATRDRAGFRALIERARAALGEPLGGGP